LAIAIGCPAWLPAQPAFQVVPLGVNGGSDESNLSAYLLAPVQSNDFICLDAGTLYAGIEKAIALHTFNVPASVILKRYIKAYFISHGHLDHLAGMIINSPDDTVKNIFALPFVMNILKEKYFSWKSWINFGDDGEPPLLKKYHYELLDTLTERAIPHTTMSARAFVLSHARPYQSSAFLINNKDNYVLYLGDTGADTLERSNRLHQLWQSVAPLIGNKKLKGIFIEVSFPDEQPDQQLFGHLTPRLLMRELAALQQVCRDNEALTGLPVIITHIKPAGNNEEKIKRQLLQHNPLRVKLIFPQQGSRIIL
jgi:3',5'-cyclic-nucleotide phosphodiesterase